MKLIINADDYGIDMDRDFGIFFCSLFKIITSTSVVVTNKFSFIQKKMIKSMHKRVSVGIHINLTDNPLITCTMEDLCEAHYNMRSKHIFWTNCLKNTIDIKQIKREIEAQIEVFYENFGFMPEHIDFHNHTNIFNNNLQSFSEIIANKLGVILRIPNEEYNFSDINDIFNDSTMVLLTKKPKSLKEIVEKYTFYYKYDMITYDYLCKKNCKNEYNLKFLGSVYGYYRQASKFYEQIGQFSENDIVQFMTHPGFFISLLKHRSNFSNGDRFIEFIQLFRIKKYCKKKNIIFISYKDINKNKKYCKKYCQKKY